MFVWNVHGIEQRGFHHKKNTMRSVQTHGRYNKIQKTVDVILRSSYHLDNIWDDFLTIENILLVYF